MKPKWWSVWVGGALLLLAGAAVVVIGCRPTPTPEPVKPTEGDDLKGPAFFEEVADSGIDWTYRNGEDVLDANGKPHLAILESLGGGVGLIDYDGDGLLDVFVVGGGTYEGPDHKTIVGRPCKLYHNLGNFKFKDVTKEVGLDGPWFYSHGVAVADYDRDGWPDLLVTGWGRVGLYHNEPVDPADPKKGRHFVDVTEKAGLKGVTWATSAAWADFDGDGYPDLYLCQYADWSWDNHPTNCMYDGKTRDVCPPKQFSGLRHMLFANIAGAAKGERAFRDVTDEAKLHPGGKDASKGLGVLAVDVNDDGKPDIYVCNDTVDNFLYINRSTKPGEFKFDEVGVPSGTARDDRGQPNGSMGTDAADYDGCGRPSIWVTNYENESHALYHNECNLRPGKVSFTHKTAAAGITAIGQKYVAWGTGFLDLDHHGWEDLFIVDGHAIRYPTGATRLEKPVLMRNTGGGKFRNAMARGGSYFDKPHLARGLALGDLDNDGRIDAVISHMNDPVSVLRNVADVGDNHWLGIELVGKDHADVVGAKIGVEAGERTLWGFTKGGCSYASSPDRRHVFGLGKADKVVKVTVTWPDRKTQEWKGDAVGVDHYIRLTQGKDEVETPGAGK